ncbi:MAG: hypothetical protein KKA28_20265 [Planctomycetes bacterium]|nr:hypothetical protein [Planctomycetota bacterium]
MGQFDHIGPRTLIELQDLDLFDKPTAPIGMDVDLEVLRDLNHPLRLELPPGPLLFCLSKDEKPKRILVDVSTLLYSELLEVRKAAFSYLNELIVDEKFEVSPKTLGILKSSQARILSDISHKWRSAAIALNDAFNDDILIALQGVKQCLECRSVLQESLNSYVPRMMYPAVSSLDSIILEVRTPEKEHPKMMEIVSSIVGSAASLHDACEDYYLRLGYIPLASPYSMGDVVDRWMAAHSSEDAWSVVWNWAHSSFGPIPQYHACSVFVLYPKLVPEGKLPDLWREILNVVIGSESKDSKNTEQTLWGLRHDLIRHFTCHLEAHLPDNDGDSIACFAWWLAERVAKIFSDETESAQFYRKNWVEPALDKSTHIWLAASPRVGSSFLRYATATVPYPWVLAFLALMGRNLEKLAPEKQETELQATFQSILISCLISALPVVVELPADPTYAVEYPLGETALKWAAHQPEELRKALEQLVSTSRTLGSADGLVTALRNLTDYSVADQAAVALILKSLVYKNQLEAISVWDIFADMEWRQKVLNSIEDRVLWILIEALSALQVRDQEKWIFLLPHYLAEVCEKSENVERQRQLFMYVLHTSLISDTVSAVHRLLRGDQKAKFAQFAKEYRELVDNMWSYYPAWVQGRLRGLLASLHVE